MICAKETNSSLLGSYKELIEGMALARQQIVAVNLPLRKYERFEQVRARLFVGRYHTQDVADR